MATLLQRLGLAAARRAWIVIAIWLVVVAGAGGAFAVAGGSLASTFAISGTPAQNVADQLQASLPEADSGTGQVVFTTSDGSAFTAEQQAGITAALTAADGTAGVSSSINPFQTEADRQAQAAQLADAATQLSAGSTQLEQSQEQLDAAKAQLTAAGDSAPAGAADQLAQQQATLDTAKTELAANQAKADAGQRLLDAAAKIQTVSTDNSTAVATVVFDKPTADVTPEAKEAAVDAIDGTSIPGVDVNYSSSMTSITIGVSAGEIIGILIAAIVLFVMLGTLVAAGLPLVSSFIGVGVGALGVLAFSGVVSMSSATITLGLMLGLAVGIDYSLFILNRHRRQLRDGIPLRESIGLANGTSGNAVMFAGITVIIALAALNVTGIGFLGLMGTAGAVVVAIAVLVALTLTPALMSLAGLRVLPKKERAALGAKKHAAPEHVGEHVAGRVGRTGGAAAGRDGRSKKGAPGSSTLATRHPVLILAAGIIALLIVAIPALSMRLALPDGKSQPTESTEYKAYTAIDNAFGAGVNGAIIVVANLPTVADDAALTSLEADVADRLLTVQNVVAAAPAGASTDNRTVIFQVIPSEGPSAASTEQVVKDLRDLSASVDSSLGVTLGVTGLTAINIDISAKLADALPVYLVIVLGLSILIMILVFRSIAVPLVATTGFLLTVLATFGAVTAVYQWGWLGFLFGIHDPAPILSFLPILLIGIIFGLAMDYQLFLTSGMREAHVHGMAARPAVNAGLRTARPVVIAAGIIMISVFGGFVFGDLVEARVIGFGLAIGVLVDAFVVRLLLVPAAMHLLGEAAWWMPRWLDRITPDVDVEGAKLERTALGDGAGPESTETGQLKVPVGA
ncbi:RND transporter [Subtercola boreus]|uniref:RND transporter n=1 Tax=Subtercola boreus TaxID=120213 RepID=A0A3E0VLL1_9MICO|nr:MMPL family transporter [Subtercola boreus]RFA10358.1 RND transporter [Subtercola boreus]TQL56132.1 RND superfamily putative drug exporter [Subtercola boreus]